MKLSSTCSSSSNVHAMPCSLFFTLFHFLPMWKMWHHRNHRFLQRPLKIKRAEGSSCPLLPSLPNCSTLHRSWNGTLIHLFFFFTLRACIFACVCYLLAASAAPPSVGVGREQNLNTRPFICEAAADLANVTRLTSCLHLPSLGFCNPDD